MGKMNGEWKENVKGLKSVNVDEQLRNVSIIRDFLQWREGDSVDQPHSLKINAIIDAGGVAPLMNLFENHPNQQIQLLAAKALTGFTFGDEKHCTVLIDAGIIPRLVKKIKEWNGEIDGLHVTGQAIWCLGNLAGTSSAIRDAIIQTDILPRLLQLLNNQQQDSFVGNACFTIRILCGGTAPVPEHVKLTAMPRLLQILQDSTNTSTLVEIGWAISHLTDSSEQAVEIVSQSGALARMIQLLREPSMISQMLRIIGNLVSSTEDVSQIALDFGCIPVLKEL